MYELCVLSLAAAAVSVTLTKAKIFHRVRLAVSRRWEWGELVHCHYCVVHWVALFLVLVYQPRPVQAAPPLDLLVAAFAIVGISAILMGVITRLIDFASV